MHDLRHIDVAIGLHPHHLLAGIMLGGILVRAQHHGLSRHRPLDRSDAAGDPVEFLYRDPHLCKLRFDELCRLNFLRAEFRMFMEMAAARDHICFLFFCKFLYSHRSSPPFFSR